MRRGCRAGVGAVLTFVALVAAAGTAAAQSLQWERTWRGSAVEMGLGAAVGTDGSLVVVGIRATSFDDNAWLTGNIRKLDGAGTPLWGKALRFAAAGVALAPDGAIYAAGTRVTTSGVPIAVLAKMKPDGSPLWQRDLPPAGGNGASRGLAVVVAPAGNVVWVGGSERTDTGWDVRLAKYTAAGQHARSVRYRPPFGTESAALGIDLDGSGNVYVAGESDEIAPGFDYVSHSRSLVAKFSRTGALVWARYLPVGPDGYDGASDVAVGPGDALYVAAGRGAADYDGVLWKLAAQTGAVGWRRIIDSGANDNLVSVAVRPGAGDVCGVGGTDDYASAFVVCYSSEGVRLWQQAAPSHAPGIAIGESLALTADGSTYVTGATTTSAAAAGIDLWVAQYR